MSEPINYLCSDDEFNDLTRAHLDSITIQSNKQLTIALRRPVDFITEVDELQKEVKNNDYSGLLLDLRLDGRGSTALYRAPALVQEIHTRAAESKFSVCPIALWSNDEKLKKSYYPDETSHDLFDLTIDKDQLTNAVYAKKIANKLLALATGYKKISENRKSDLNRAIELLDMPKGVASAIDPRIIAPIKLRDRSVIYDQARFIHRQLLSIPNNAIVSSELLAARLGLIYNSVANFDELIERLFPTAKYKGVFSEGWSCWWMPEVEKLWLESNNCPGPLRRLTAEVRVSFLNSLLGRDDLEAAKPLKFNASTTYWTICQITRRPLDIQEGFVVDRQLQPWQLTQYISLFGKLDGSESTKEYRVDPLELERFKEAKTLALKK